MSNDSIYVKSYVKWLLYNVEILIYYYEVGVQVYYSDKSHILRNDLDIVTIRDVINSRNKTHSRFTATH